MGQLKNMENQEVKNSQKKEATELGKAYFAGVLDSGSSVGFYKVGTGREVPMVRIRRRQPENLRYIKNFWKGSLVQTKTAWELTLTYRSAVRFLQDIRKFLINPVKQQAADQIIEFYRDKPEDEYR